MRQTHKLLVVEDEPDILYFIVRALANCGFAADNYTDPIEAITHIEKHANHYSLVLSDIRMPGMSGMDFLNFVKEIRPGIPIMAMTAYLASDDEIVAAIPWLTKGEIMHKPFSAQQICNTAKRCSG